MLTVLTLEDLQDYELLDSGNQQRLERYGSYRIVRPDPQLIWKPGLEEKDWEKADAVFERLSENKGEWVMKKQIPEKWLMHYKKISFYAKLTPFKHTGVFPEQAIHWGWMGNLIEKAKRPINVLNLFGYTGISSLVCAGAGASVTHVDASHPTIGWARLNQTASKLEDRPIRWILDDAVKFVQREIRRGAKYDAIIMDPPAYGRGPKGETWSFNTSFPMLMEDCKQILSDNPLFVLVNAYAISSSALTLENVLMDFLPKGHIECGELCIKEKSAGRLLSTGIFARWSASN
jgi:23S rRNA (cytosine1962-C5)-methyltransferase